MDSVLKKNKSLQDLKAVAQSRWISNTKTRIQRGLLRLWNSDFMWPVRLFSGCLVG